MSIFESILETVAKVGMNSYTKEEKEAIEAARKILIKHDKTEAVSSLDKVIDDMNLGFTRRSE